MMGWYLAVLRKYAEFDGRARRTEYWTFAVVSFLIAMALSVVSIVINDDFYILVGLYSLAVLVPSVAVTVRRLQDTGRSGWWVLISLIPVVGGIVLFVLALLPGMAGPNLYGPDPRQEAPAYT